MVLHRSRKPGSKGHPRSIRGMGVMERVINEIDKELSKSNITIDKSSIKEISSHGMMSEIFSCKSNVGELIIHLVSANIEQRRQKTYLKIRYVSDFLKHTKIPHAEVLLSKYFGRKYLIVQKRISGKVPKNDNRISKKLYELLHEIHSIKTNDFGFIKKFHGNLTGTFKSWEEFLTKESRLWLKSICKSGIISKSENKKYQNLLKNYLLKNMPFIKCKSPKLIHGDMINVGNVIVKNGKINGIIDFEWAMSGDPAWEFARKGIIPKKYYYKDEDKKDFENRIKIYFPLVRLWIAYAIHDKNIKLSKTILKDFEKYINA